MEFSSSVHEARRAVNESLTLAFSATRVRKGSVHPIPARSRNPVATPPRQERCIATNPTRGQHAVLILDAYDRDVRTVTGRRAGRPGAPTTASLKRKPRPVGRGFAL